MVELDVLKEFQGLSLILDGLARKARDKRRAEHGIRTNGFDLMEQGNGFFLVAVPPHELQQFI